MDDACITGNTLAVQTFVHANAPTDVKARLERPISTG